MSYVGSEHKFAHKQNRNHNKNSQNVRIRIK